MIYNEIEQIDTSYQVLYADPPWSYTNKKTGGSLVSGASSKYDTMPLDEICSLPIKDITDKDSVAYVWATVPLLPEGLKVLDAWGYKYKTMISWRKIMSLGLGYWYRGQTEHLLFGTRGKIKAFRMQEANIIQHKVLRHSEKPHAFRELIERSVGDMRKIELFARQECEGWDCFGNQVAERCQTIKLF